jgi:hypothetical protein
VKWTEFERKAGQFSTTVLSDVRNALGRWLGAQ